MPHSPAPFSASSSSSSGPAPVVSSSTPAVGPVVPAPWAGAEGAGRPARAGGRSVGQAERPVGAAAAGAVPTGTAPGLVLCAISGRTPEKTEVPDTVAGLWAPRFPSPELVDAAAALLPAVTEQPGTLAEGPRWELTVGPGMFAVACHDWARQERTAARQHEAHVKDVDLAVAHHLATGEWDDPAPTRQGITGWSRKSRARMVRRLCELDYTPLYAGGRLPAMVTLTYPGDWETVVPTGDVLKRHMKALAKRYQRAWGEDWRCVWKLEFQRRGAPHVHMLCTPPHGLARRAGERFAVWLSRNWAEVVDHPDPEQRRRHHLAGTALDYAEGLRATDPRRVAAYFTKHGLMAAKEYQHDVPVAWQTPGTGPGRFWGVWHLDRAVRTIAVTPTDGIRAGRVARRWAKAQRRAQSTYKMRVDQSTGRVRYRKSRSRVRLMTNGNRGWIALNNGPAFAWALGSHLERLGRGRNRGPAAGEPGSVSPSARFSGAHAPDTAKVGDPTC